VRRLDSWIKIGQLDVTCFIISLFTAQHVSNVSTSILRSLWLIYWVISWVVLLWLDVCWCYVVVRLGWCGIWMQTEACIQMPHHLTNKSQDPEDGCTNIRNMWNSKQWNNKASDIKLGYLYSAVNNKSQNFEYHLSDCNVSSTRDATTSHNHKQLHFEHGIGDFFYQLKLLSSWTRNSKSRCLSITLYADVVHCWGWYRLIDCNVDVVAIVARDSSVGIATCYGLGGPDIVSQMERVFRHPSMPALGHIQPPIERLAGHSRG
jgi:hypothetical protein